MGNVNWMIGDTSHINTEKLSEIAQYAEFVPGGLFVYHEKEPWEILFVNQKLIEMLGCKTLEEFKLFTGYTFKGLVHPKDFDMIQNSIEKQCKYKDTDHVEYRVVCKDGSVRWVDDYGKLVTSEQYGNLFCVFVTDITEKKKEEEARNEQLRMALEDAKQMNVAKTAFFSRMSHELKTPINAIISLSNMALEESELMEKTRVYLEKIDSSAKYLLASVNDILEMSFIESGRVTLKEEAFLFRDMIEQVNILIQGQCDEKGLFYQCRVLGEVEDYYIGDEIRLKQILLNILGNSVKFTPSGGKLIMTIERVSQYSGMSTLCFIIKDTGIGMKEEYLPKLFETFTQEDSTTKNEYGGSGLGMPIAKNLIEMMNGQIFVQSEKGVGSEFKIMLTLKDKNWVGEEQEKVEVLYSDIQKGLEGKRVLVVEDNEINMEIMMELLQVKGVEVEGAENGQIALDMFEQSSVNYYDAILMDIRMPVMDGWESASAIRQLSREDAVTIPIVAVTANALEEDVQRSLQVGMNAHFSKPVEVELLYEILQTLVN